MMQNAQNVPHKHTQDLLPHKPVQKLLLPGSVRECSSDQ